MTLALPSTIETRKAEAATIFGSHGVPTRRVEDWKYSDLKMALGEAGIGTDQALWQVDALPDGVEQFDLSKPNPPDWVQKHFAVADRNIMGAASLTLSDGGVALRVAKGAQINAPLNLAFNGSGHVRGLLVLEDGASLTLVEGVGIADFRNVGFEIVLGEGASLEHIRISPEAGDAVLVEEASLRIAVGARYRAHFAGFGSKLSRMELEIALEGEGAQAHLSGVSVLDGKPHHRLEIADVAREDGRRHLEPLPREQLQAPRRVARLADGARRVHHQSPPHRELLENGQPVAGDRRGDSGNDHLGNGEGLAAMEQPGSLAVEVHFEIGGADDPNLVAPGLRRLGEPSGRRNAARAGKDHELHAMTRVYPEPRFVEGRLSGALTPVGPPARQPPERPPFPEGESATPSHTGQWSMHARLRRRRREAKLRRSKL